MSELHYADDADESSEAPLTPDHKYGVWVEPSPLNNYGSDEREEGGWLTWKRSKRTYLTLEEAEYFLHLSKENKFWLYTLRNRSEVPVIDEDASPAPKCSAAQFCQGMRLALRGVPWNFTGKGLSASFGWLGEDNRSGLPRLVGVTYAPRAGDTIILNFCPWCGARIRFDEEARCQARESEP